MQILSNHAPAFSGRFWRGGEYSAWVGNPNEDWSGEKLPPASKQLTIELPGDGPQGAIITCRTPRENNGRVRAYPSLRHGTYEGGVPEDAFPAIRVKDLMAVHHIFALDYRELHGGAANILLDSFLLPDPQNHKKKAFELGIMLKPSPAAVAHANTQGQWSAIFYDSSGRGWNMTLFEKADGSVYLMAIPLQKASLVGFVDQLEMYRWALGRAIIAPGLWYTGTALGPEIIAGVAQLVVNDWNVSVK